MWLSSIEFVIRLMNFQLVSLNQILIQSCPLWITAEWRGFCFHKLAKYNKKKFIENWISNNIVKL